MFVKPYAEMLNFLSIIIYRFFDSFNISLILKLTIPASLLFPFLELQTNFLLNLFFPRVKATFLFDALKSEFPPFDF